MVLYLLPHLLPVCNVFPNWRASLTSFSALIFFSSSSLRIWHTQGISDFCTASMQLTVGKWYALLCFMVRIQWIMTDSFSVWQSGSPHAWCAKNMALIETSIISSTITLVAIQSTRRTKKCGMMVLWPILPYVPGLKLWTLIAMCTTIPALHNLYTAKSSDGCLCIEFDLKNINKCRVIFGSVH